MEKGVWRSWQVILGAVLTMVCLSCQPRVAPLPRQAPPPPPVAAPKPPPQRETFFVKVGRLNLRAGPGMDFPKLGLLERNEEVEKLGEAENWYQVRLKRDGTLGWVSSEFLSKTPVTSPIVTPVPEAPPAPPAETKPTPPAKVETTVPRAPKPAEAPEEMAPKAKPAAEKAPAPEPKAVQEKPAPKQEEPPPPPPPPPPAPPQPEEQQGGGVRIM
jgi:Bacterial SH3 domain